MKFKSQSIAKVACFGLLLSFAGLVHARMDHKSGGGKDLKKRPPLKRPKIKPQKRGPQNSKRDLSSQTQKRFDRRMDNQRKRVGHGLKNDRLTKGEKKVLRKDFRKTKRLHKKIMADGAVSPKEARKMEGRLDKNSRHIFRAKHNKKGPKKEGGEREGREFNRELERPLKGKRPEFERKEGLEPYRDSASLDQKRPPKGEAPELADKKEPKDLEDNSKVSEKDLDNLFN
ncbi:MAG: hypothetical protein ACPGJV_10565 [Bacteriovoracaceae bacterium]